MEGPLEGANTIMLEQALEKFPKNASPQNLWPMLLRKLCMHPRVRRLSGSVLIRSKMGVMRL